jgi:hypothetical protein
MVGFGVEDYEKFVLNAWEIQTLRGDEGKREGGTRKERGGVHRSTTLQRRTDQKGSNTLPYTSRKVAFTSADPTPPSAFPVHFGTPTRRYVPSHHAHTYKRSLQQQRHSRSEFLSHQSITTTLVMAVGGATSTSLTNQDAPCQMGEESAAACGWVDVIGWRGRDATGVQVACLGTAAQRVEKVATRGREPEPDNTTRETPQGAKGEVKEGQEDL